MADLKRPEHLKLDLFGKIPVYQGDGLVPFETGAILLHIASRHLGLLPGDEAARERAIVWMFAALGTIEPPILEREAVLYLEQEKPWSKERMPLVEDRVRGRLDQLSDRLGDAEWIDGDFNAGDLMTIASCHPRSAQTSRAETAPISTLGPFAWHCRHSLAPQAVGTEPVPVPVVILETVEAL